MNYSSGFASVFQYPFPEQSFRPFLEEFSRCRSSAELENSALYRKLKPQVDTLLSHVWREDFAAGEPAAPRDSVRAVAWNIERGLRAAGVTRILKDDARLREADVLLLSELDLGMARTGNRFIARDIARDLKMNYAFAPCYIALTKGAGIEKHVEGENAESLHGNALMSPHPLRNVHSLALINGKDKMSGSEKRIGSQRAVIADILHPAGTFRAVSVHLDAHSSQRHRHSQMRGILDHLETLSPRLPVLIGGDWNTTTHDASRALYSILGYCRRVLMGVRHVVANHYPYPERWFERRLFSELEARGYNYRDLNNPGECTLHYRVDDIATNLNMREWVPQWCFWFINQALARTGGRCSLKVDWFAARGIRRTSDPAAIHDLTDDGFPVSDHDPIVLEFRVDSAG